MPDSADALLLKVIINTNHRPADGGLEKESAGVIVHIEITITSGQGPFGTQVVTRETRDLIVELRPLRVIRYPWLRITTPFAAWWIHVFGLLQRACAQTRGQGA